MTVNSCFFVKVRTFTLTPSNDHVDSSTSTTDSATLTEPDLLGPCEPGTKLVVEGVVWLETQGKFCANCFFAIVFYHHFTNEVLLK